MKKILIILVIFFLLFGCAPKREKYTPKTGKINPRKPMSWGHRQTIYIFAEDDIWNLLHEKLENNLGRVYFTTNNENYFEIKRAPLKSLQQFFKFNNILFLSYLNSESELANYIKEIMGEKAEKDLKKNGVAMYPLDNLWANDQFVLFLLANDKSHLLKLYDLQENKIFELFKNKLYERIARQVYKQDIYPQSEFAGFPWTLKLPKSYILYKKDSQNRFVSYIARLREHADRYISVYYEKLDKTDFGKNWLKKKRAELAWKYYDEDEFAEKDIRTEKTKLGNFDCWKLSGRWQNKKYLVGGAFQSFAFYDEKTKTAFLIDNSVYFPEGYKLSALIELEVISGTFRLK